MSELQTLWLPVALAALAVLVLLLDIMQPARAAQPSGRNLGALVAIALLALFGASFFIDGSGKAAYGAYEGGAWTSYFQRVFLATGILAALGGIDDVAKRTPHRQGEYWLILLFSLVGMALLPGARDLVLIVVSFELMGLPLYILAAYSKTDAAAFTGDEPRTRASEASLKLYLVGATSTAITLLGLAFLTGMAGSTRLATLASVPMTPLAALGLVMVLGGIGYKIGMVPFHMWVPDTYQGARLPFVAFLSVGPKAAGISVMATIFLFGLGSKSSTWMPPLAMIAFLSMAVGNFLALPQKDLRRLLGYSGIAQMGYVLLGVVANDGYGLGMVLFFMTAYVFTNLGAFLVLHVAAEAGGGYGFEGVSGLWRRSPALGVALACFLLSLAGIPFMVGFWAKLFVFLAAWRAGHEGLVIAAIVLAVLGLFYYLRMLRAAYMTDEGDLPIPTMGVPMKLAIGICVAAVIGLGLWPQPLVDASLEAGRDLIGQTAHVQTPPPAKLTQR